MLKHPALFAAACLLGTGSLAFAQSPNYHVEVHNPAKFDSGEALKQTPGQDVAEAHRPLLNLPRQSQGNNRPDGALQTSSGPLVNTVGGPGFEGVAASGYAPPDTNMAVGPNHIVQWVNVQFAIYNKSGVILPGYPKAGNAFWSGFGGPCETQNSGDPIIQYDVVADRWIAAQFTTTAVSGNYYECFAISQTGDPNGAYNRYSYAFTQFPDYPKIGVWKNAYFASYNIFSSTSGGWIGPRICAYDRAAMLAGTSAVSECFNPGSAYGSLLPSDLDGGAAFAPPSPTGYFLDFGNNSLLLWQFTPNFVTPANATLTGPVSLAAASFSPACGGGTCIPQQGGSNLDSLADRLMYRLAYRNFGSYESMVVNQSVTAGTSVGVRWYEIRNPLTAPAIFQQGTFAPDATYRWMGSIAQDKVGNIAVGYSASSTTSVTSIRYTGRETADPLNTLQTEKIEYTSGGAQSGISRWGDYSAMRIDPANDCTFWYTTEYIPATGSFNWRTRVATFSFPSCTGTPAPDFTISASPSSQTAAAGNGPTYNVSTGVLNGFSGSVTLSASGLPSGATASLSPQPVAAGSSSTMTVTTTSATPAGTYTVTITGTSGTTVHSTTVTLAVQNFAISATPSSQTVIQGSNASYTATVTPQSGFAAAVALTVTGLPNNATASFSPASLTSGSSTLTISTLSSTPAGSYTLTITGTSGATVHSATVTLIVQSPATFTLSASQSSQTIAANGRATYTITVTPVNNFTGVVTFSLSGLPPRTNASFSPTSSATTTTLTVNANRNARAGTSTLTITGTSPGQTAKTVQVTLIVQ